MKKNFRMMLFFMTMVIANFVHGQTNLLPNGNFSPSNGIDGWTAAGLGSIAFTTMDADIIGGGSMILTAPDSYHSETATSSCIAVTPNA